MQLTSNYYIGDYGGGSYFAMFKKKSIILGNGLGNSLFIITFFIFGSIIGIHFKIISSTIIFLFIFIGSLFGKGNGTTLALVFTSAQSLSN